MSDDPRLTGAPSASTFEVPSHQLPSHQAPSHRAPSHDGPSRLGPDDAVPHGHPALAAALAGAGLIHLAMVPTHAGASTIDGVGLAVMGWVQLVLAVTLVTRPSRMALAVGTVFNLGVLGVWAWSRTVGLPFGGHAGEVETLGLVDLAASLLEVGFVAGAGMTLARPVSGTTVRRLGPVPGLVASGALLLTTVAVTSSSATSLGHSDGEAHGHADGAAHHHDDGSAEAEVAAAPAEPCDRGLNPVEFWSGASEATAGGSGGGLSTAAPATTPPTTPPPTTAPATGDGHDHADGHDHDHGSGTTSTTVAAAPSAAESGPQPWVDLTDEAVCDALTAELAAARAATTDLRTVADAQAAGFTRLSPYRPGVGAHFVHAGRIDAELVVDEPELLLFDGDGPAAHLVGVGYYVVGTGSGPEPTGFSGGNVRFFPYVGLCMVDGSVTGDAVDPAGCEASGGRVVGGDGAVMAHAWVVEGCASPWGIFSVSNPVLDEALGAASATSPDTSPDTGPSCGASGAAGVPR